jgi:Calcineurin-like phosphoesterase/Iron/zinc purple acid phosphatase-like protein C
MNSDSESAAHHRRHKKGGHGGTTGHTSGDPIFAQPKPSPDPTTFKDPVTDAKEPDVAGVQAVPQPAGGAAEPILTLAQVYGSQGAGVAQTIQQSGQIVFHSVGDTGSVIGPVTQSLVADKMVSDFTEANAADVPSFFFHLGDVVYYFGEGTYYYDQFYEPYRNYPAPILGLAGNHDGIVYPKDPEPTLDAYLRNFCSAAPGASSDAGGLSRTTMIQPGVYYTFDAPFVRILGLYSNVLEDPGVISDQGGTYATLDQRQVTFLTTALARVKSEAYAGAVIIAMHHPPFTGGSQHGGSPLMLADIDKACTAAGVWPHAVLSGHAHNYQRYTRTVNEFQIPYVVAGCGGHSPLSAMRSTLRTPYVIDSTLTLESYDDTDYGYLRIVVNAQTMTIEFHPESDGGTTKTPDDAVTINLSTHTVS